MNPPPQYAQARAEIDRLVGNVALQDTYVDRDDLLKAIGAAAQAVSIDGTLVHNGASPILEYVTRPSGNVTRRRTDRELLLHIAALINEHCGGQP